ncbi:prepilin peptidase [Microvirga sp. CF3062]|uniref:A24 family peptidase n=1 Tax=Microvirga sp. CF3062 TaxID=3110182 RepID=UPI002E789338|nr:prepilin peptidase [Microvirga sp. CF3062]MEE1656964.1 prepilin peptidase [Microvirga sp. CF3062]
MTISAMAGISASLCFAAATLWAAASDLTTMKIRNELVLFLLAVYAALAPLAGFGVVEIGLSAAVAFGVLVCMFAFFALGWIGGGDAKLAAVVALWLGADHAPAFVIYTALFGGIVTLALLQFRTMPLPAICHRLPWVVKLHQASVGVPYGIAISLAGLLTFSKTPWIAALS